MSHNKNTKHETPEEVVARIPLTALRSICATDPDLCQLASALDALKLQTSKKKNDGQDKENATTHNNVKQQMTTRSSSNSSSAQTIKRRKEAPKEKEKEKELSGHEARRRVVLEVERGAVRLLCEWLSKATLVETVQKLAIDCGQGNNPTSRAVASKRLTEHIAQAHGGVGLSAFLEEEASEDVVQQLVEALPSTTMPPPQQQKKARRKAVQAALEHEALMAFFQSLPEAQLHQVCVAMKNERAHDSETRSRHLLAASIIADRPVAQLLRDEEEKKDEEEKEEEQVKELSKKKPKLREGVTYADVFQWYNVSELQAFARDKGIKVSGKKKELIERVLAFLADPDSVLKPAPKKKKTANKNKKQQTKMNNTTGNKKPASKTNTSNESAPAEPMMESVECFTPDPKLAALLEVVTTRCLGAQKGLSAAQIDAFEAERSKQAGVRIRFPDALRQLFMHCNGYNTDGEVLAEDAPGAGVRMCPLVGTTPDEWHSTLTTFDQDQPEWLESFVEKGGKPEDCVASPHWLAFADRGEYQFFCVNISPTTAHYGQVYSACINEGCGETLWCNSVEEFVEKTAQYFPRRDKIRQEILDEDPDISLDQLDDLVGDEAQFGDNDDDGSEADDDDNGDEEDEGEEEGGEMEE